MGSQDPVLTLLKDQGLSVVRVPREGLPCLTIAQRDGARLVKIGTLDELFVPPATGLPAVTTDQIVANMEGQRTRSLDINLALTLLKGFLSALGAGTLGIEAAFASATTATFQFSDVRLDEVTVVALDKFLGAARLDPNARATGQMLDAGEVYVFTQVLRSNNLRVTTSSQTGGSVGVDVPTLQQIVGGSVNVKAAAGSSTTVSFTGQQRLAFAFQAVQLVFDDGQYRTLRELPPGDAAASFAPRRIPAFGPAGSEAAIAAFAPEPSIPEAEKSDEARPVLFRSGGPFVQLVNGTVDRPAPAAAAVPAAAGLSPRIEEELRAQGYAQVIVSMDSMDALNQVGTHFMLPQTLMATTAAAGLSRPHVMRSYRHLKLAMGFVSREGLAGLRAANGVHSVHAAPVLSLVRPVRVAAAALTNTITWGIDTLRVPTLWAAGIRGGGVTVGHLDTGADGKHPALASAIAHFAEFDDDAVEVSPAPSAYDTAEHGTHTAGTIAGRAVGGRSIGVAPEALLASAIVIEGGQVLARVLAGLDWVLGREARVLSMSLGFRGYVGDFLVIVQAIRAAGTLPVFAVGNEGPNTSRSPGNYVEVLSVGACDAQTAVADFSSSQTFARPNDPVVPDVVAPGVGVVSAKPGGGYQSMDGSSMATPHVAGLAALLFQAKPAATVDEVEQAIFASARLGRMAPIRAGRGLPDAVAAFTQLTGSPPPSPAARPAPARVMKSAAAKKKPKKPR
jgi:subtilisin family serine protease